MASCFTNPNKKKLSAKEYTIKKRRKTIFCDLRVKALQNITSGVRQNAGNNEGCVDKDGIFFKYKDHKAQIDMLRAFEDFRTDLLRAVQGQLFKDHFCSPYFINSSNIDISNNYTADNIQLAFGEGTFTLPNGTELHYGQLTNYFGALNRDIVSVHPPGEGKYKNTYAEIKPVDTNYLGPADGGYASGFENNKFFLFKPPVCDNITRPQVFRSGDFPAPEALGITILIEDKDGFNAPQIIGVQPIIE